MADQRPVGWLTDEEAACLARLARDKTVLEIGSYAGRSTVTMAITARHVVSVDHHRGSEEHQKGAPAHDERFVDVKTGLFTTFPVFLENLKAWAVEDKVTVMISPTSALAVLAPVFELIFVDASHDYEHVSLDAAIARNLLWQGRGVMAFHDYGGHGGVFRAVNELAAGREIETPAGCLAVVRF